MARNRSQEVELTEIGTESLLGEEATEVELTEMSIDELSKAATVKQLDVAGMWAQIVHVFGKPVDQTLGKSKLVSLIKQVVFDKPRNKDWGMGVVYRVANTIALPGGASEERSFRFLGRPKKGTTADIHILTFKRLQSILICYLSHISDLYYSQHGVRILNPIAGASMSHVNADRNMGSVGLNVRHLMVSSAPVISVAAYYGPSIDTSYMNASVRAALAYGQIVRQGRSKDADLQFNIDVRRAERATGVPANGETAGRLAQLMTYSAGSEMIEQIATIIKSKSGVSFA
jgi:hypothetical protein